MEKSENKNQGEPDTPAPRQGWMENMAAARTVFIQTLVLNVLVAAAKIIWGFMSNTLSMLADGLHSLLDATSNVIGIVGLTKAMEPPDTEHPYGHRKFEALSAIAISFFMFLTAFEVLNQVIDRVFAGGSASPAVSAVSFGVMIVTAVVNFFVCSYERRKGEELKSPLLIADSQHTLSDIFVTGTVFVTLVALHFKFYFVDTIASLGIVAFVCKAGYDIIKTHLGALVDAAVLDPAVVEAMVMEVKGVIGCHRIRSRGTPEHTFVDMHILVSRDLSIEEAHKISYEVEQKLQSLGKAIDVLVHIEDDRHELPD